MPAMGGADGRNVRRVAGRGQPVVNRRADASALDGRLAGPVVAGDQQQDAISAVDRLLEVAVDRRPGAVQVEAVEVEHSIGLEIAAADALVP